MGKSGVKIEENKAKKSEVKRKMKKFRSRKFGLLVYPDDANHVQVLEAIKSYDYAMILHDRDCDGDGVLLKAHWHIVLASKNAQWSSALAKELGLKENYILQIRNEECALEYLIHYNEPNKYQYSMDDVKGPRKRKLVEYIARDDKSEHEKVDALIEYIENNSDWLTVTYFAKHCARSGMWDIFRRSGAIFMRILSEQQEKKYIDK